MILNIIGGDLIAAKIVMKSLPLDRCDGGGQRQRTMATIFGWEFENSNWDMKVIYLGYKTSKSKL